MELTSIAARFAITLALGTMMKLGGTPLPRTGEIETDSTAKLVCKTGLKPGKTPVSLIIGAKPACVNIAAASAGKKLFVATTKPCFACHGSFGPNPVSQANTNLRNQGFNLKPASILAAFTLHSDQMLGSTITAKDAKNISAYLQTIK